MIGFGSQYEAHLPTVDPDTERIQRLMRAASQPESIRHAEEVLLVNRIQQRNHRPLDDLVLQSRDRERALPAIRLGYVDPPARQCPIRSTLDPVVQALEIALEVCLVVRPRQLVHSRRSILLELEQRRFQNFDSDVMQERGELFLLTSPRDFPYAFQRL